MILSKISKYLFILVGFLVGVGVGGWVSELSYFGESQDGGDMIISNSSSVDLAEAGTVISGEEALGKQPLTPDSPGWVEKIWALEGTWSSVDDRKCRAVLKGRILRFEDGNFWKELDGRRFLVSYSMDFLVGDFQYCCRFSPEGNCIYMSRESLSDLSIESPVFVLSRD